MNRTLAILIYIALFMWGIWGVMDGSKWAALSCVPWGFLVIINIVEGAEDRIVQRIKMMERRIK